MPDTNAPPPVAVTPAPTTKPTPEPTHFVDREPTLVKNLTTAGGAIVTWLVARGTLNGADETLAGILIPIAALGFAGWWSRRSTTSVARAQDAIEIAYTAQPGIGTKPTL